MSRSARVLCLVALLAPAAQAEELGRLFFTPEQRAALDARRKARIPDKPAAVSVESPVTRVDGIVRRQGGRSTVWLNGFPNPEGASPEGMQVAPARRDPQGVSLSVGEGERSFELKVGQKLDRGSGTVSDVLGEGAVRVRPGRGQVTR
jgi:predicted amidohydrolase